MEGVEELKFS